MALSMPSIWQTRSSSAMAQGDAEKEPEKIQDSMVLVAKKAASEASPAKADSSKSSSGKESEQQKDKDELENVLLPSDGSQSTAPRNGPASDTTVGGPIGDSDPVVGDSPINGATPYDASAPGGAVPAGGSVPPAKGAAPTDGGVATDGMGAVTGSVSQNEAWPGEDDDDAVPSVPPVDAKSAPPLSAVIEKNDGKIELKSERPLTDAEKNRQLIGEAIAKFGSPGLFLVSYMNGPWTIQNTLKSSSGERSGLKPGDTIISIDGRYITGMKIRDVYFVATGYRGQYRQFVINRDGFIKTISVPLWGINDMKDRRTQYIEYYWYLLYHNLMSVDAYNRAVAPFLYFKVPKFKPMPTGK